ncbi:MAG: AEC family transporter [Planctomycetaceae bacterium]|nr:AEC family transporter [Planctomycetaceae bacterium]
MIKILADALAPIFTGLLLGYCAGLWGVMDNRNVKTLITFVMSFAIPCSLFLAIAGTPRAALRTQAASALVLAIVYFVLYALSFVWTRSKEHLNNADSSVVALTLAFQNSAAVGLPLLASVFGPQARVTVATSIALGSITVSPITLAMLDSSGKGPSEGVALKTLAVSVARSFKKPIVWAPLLGLVFSFAGVEFPPFIHRSLAVMGSASDGSALVLTGLVVSAQPFEMGSSVLFAVFLKNVFMPAIALALCLLFHLPADQMRYLLLISAIPAGFFGVVFAKAVGSSPKLASSGLIASNLFGIGTLAAWIVIVNHLG